MPAILLRFLVELNIKHQKNRGHGPLLPKLVGFDEDADGDVQAEFEGVVVQAVFADAV